MHRPRLLLFISIVALAVLVRVTPYVLERMGLTDVTQFASFLWNFSPITALFLFGGAQFSQRRWAYLAPLAAIFISDVAIGLLLKDMSKGLHPGIPAIYGSYLLIVWLGTQLRKLQAAPSSQTPRGHAGELPGRRWQKELQYLLVVAGAGIAGEILFFVVTNFAAWIALTDYYPRSAAGLMQCFVMGIPFFEHAVASTPIFAIALFGGCALAETWFPALQQHEPTPAQTRQTVVA